MMSSLTRIQDDFQAFLLRDAAEVHEHVVGTDRMPVANRLAIYADAYRSRLIEALEVNYPALAKLLGPHDFAALGSAYVCEYQSTFRSIRHYGAEMATFLGRHADYAQAPVLAELARWEWAMTEAFDAADSEPVGVIALASVPPNRWAELRFELHPSLRRLALYWNAPQMWQALTSDDVERPQPRVEPQATQWIVWRQALQTFFRSLPVSEAEALDATIRGDSFGDVCSRLCAHHGEADTPARAAGLLRGWVEAGLVTEIK